MTAISERTRDKQSAARPKGKWADGYPVLGYDPELGYGRLILNEGEADQVREISGLFLRDGSLDSTLAEMRQRGWRMQSPLLPATGSDGGKPSTDGQNSSRFERVR
jgi:site-specific DNA recombinase